MANSGILHRRHPLIFLILLRVTATSAFLLIITGFYIHYPIWSNGGGFLISMIRGVHFFVAGVLIISTLLRIFLLFFGKNRDWKSFLPSFKDIAILPKVACHYIHLCDMPEITKKYNPLQMITYTATFLLMLFQILSGLALMYPDGWMSWLNYGIFSSEVNTRVAHYVVNWILVLYLIVHTYLAIRDSFAETKELFMVEGSKKD